MLTLVSYSDKAIAVIGDTKNFRAELKAAGGRFNAKLSCGAGWIFSKRSQSAVEKIVAKANNTPVKEDNPLEGMRVYVGTYHKYNSGSIAGAWLNIADYKDKSEFLAACRALHKDESDPEFMFQDYEGIPSWFVRESSIDAELWSWKPEKEGTQTKAQIRESLAGALRDSRDLDYYVRNTSAVVEDGGRIFAISKPSIETRFCHPDEPREEVEAWRKAVRTYEFFESENMGDIDRQIERLKKADLEGKNPWLESYATKSYNGLWNFYCDVEERDRRYTKDETSIPMAEELRQKLLKALEGVRADFEKRLRTWWKKYGFEKLHTWTYWQDA